MARAFRFRITEVTQSNTYKPEPLLWTQVHSAIVDPELYERYRSLVTYSKFLLIEGALQNVDKVIHIRARHIEELIVTAAPMQSHDFH